MGSTVLSLIPLFTFSKYPDQLIIKYLRRLGARLSHGFNGPELDPRFVSSPNIQSSLSSNIYGVLGLGWAMGSTVLSLIPFLYLLQMSRPAPQQSQYTTQLKQRCKTAGK